MQNQTKQKPTKSLSTGAKPKSKTVNNPSDKQTSNKTQKKSVSTNTKTKQTITKPSTASKNSVTKKKIKSQVNLKKISSKAEDLSMEQLTTLGYVLAGLYFAFLIFRYAIAILKLQPVVITNNILFILILAALPFGLWVYSTQFDRFNFHTRKKILLYLVCANAIGTLIQPLVYISYKYVVSKVVKIPITENMTINMVLNLGRMAMIVPLIIATLLIAMPLKEYLTAVKTQEKLDVFKINHHVDMRKNKNHLYDMAVMKDIDTGAIRTIKESDRFLHLFINGASGTGKTSSTITPAIANDLDKKIENMKLREPLLLDMVKNRHAYVVGPVANINEYNVHPFPKYIDEYKEIYKKYPDCGITVMAPDASLNDDVIKLCEARGIPCNVIDPSKTYDGKYAHRKGINPFYIPLDLKSEKDRNIAINDAATAFTQVILTANQTQGPGDPYFGEINDSVTTNIAIAVMLANSIKRRQTSIVEIQQCINNFADLTNYIKVIEDYFQIDVKASEVLTKKELNQKNTNTAVRDIKNSTAATNSNLSEGRDNEYYQTIQFIKQELLGPGQEKMFDQARGLRNLINFILRDPRYLELLSVPQEMAINYNQILYRSEVTVINTALEFGQKKSTAFGLFNLLNFAIEVKKRLNPDKTLISPHFLWIDEASQWMHPVYDELINLWRKFKVSGNLAMQSVSQMEKSQATAYLKEVILKAGTQVIFGRVSAEEMKMYSDLAGIMKEDMEQKTTSTSSLLAANASQSTSVRTTPNNANVLEGSNIRIRDFQEVTVFGVDEGRVIPGYIAKLNFAPKSAFAKRQVVRVNWAKYLKKKKVEAKLVKPAEEIRQEQIDILANNRTNVTVIENNVEEPKVATPIDETFDIESILKASIFEDEAVEDTSVLGSSGEDGPIEDDTPLNKAVEAPNLPQNGNTPETSSEPKDEQISASDDVTEGNNAPITIKQDAPVIEAKEEPLFDSKSETIKVDFSDTDLFNADGEMNSDS